MHSRAAVPCYKAALALAGAMNTWPLPRPYPITSDDSGFSVDTRLLYIGLTLEALQTGHAGH